MRIGMSFAALTNKGGIGRYVRLLASGLKKYFPENQYVGYVPKFRETETLDVMKEERIDGWETVIVPGYSRFGYETRGLPAILKSNAPDIFHGPDYLVPDAPCPVCVTVHDLAFRLYPSGMALKSRFLFNILAPKSIKRAANNGIVFCDSESTRRDLVKIGWLAENKGQVVYLACEDEFREWVSDEVVETVLNKYDIPKDYVLYVGPIEKRKNIGVLLDAYRRIEAVLAKRGMPIPPLVAAGPVGAGGKRLLKEFDKAGEGNFIHLGYVGRDELRALYAGCMVFCYPSLYEGFGLPPLEAMCAGRAVIVSKAASLPEVVGDAGILIEPDNSLRWSGAILRMLLEKEQREIREAASLEQSKKFSIEKMCREVMDGYKSCVKK